MDDKRIIELTRQMSTKLDLLRVLNIIKARDLGTSMYDFSIRQLNYYSNPKISKNRYITFKIPKKAGGFRTISAPCSGLKMLQTEINSLLKLLYHPSENTMGFVEGKSIVSNASCHLHKIYVLNIDLENFFPSISQARIWGRLQVKPFNFSKEIASTIAGICCMEVKEEVGCIIVEKNVLPQGAPTSPLLSNAICDKLDRCLTGLAKRFNLNYSRYADDITFSGNTNVFKEDGDFWKELKRIVKEQNFNINEKKTRLQRKGEHQEVTGLTVGEKINVSRKYVRDLRSLLYIWKRYGYDSAIKKFTYYYLLNNNKRLPKGGIANMENVIEGKLDYLLMVKGSTDKTYKRLRKEFDQLRNKSSEIIDTLFRESDTKIAKNHVLTKHIHSPLSIYNFMKNFSKGNHPLKYTTHRWDRDENGKFTWNDFDSFNEAYEKDLRFADDHMSLAAMYNYSKPLRNTIYNFLRPHGNDDRVWSKEYGLKIGYHYPEGALKQWMDNHPGNEPYQMPMLALDKQYRPKLQIHGHSIVYFGDVINVFKQAIEFRDEALYNLFKTVFKSVNYNIDEKDFESLKGWDIYTDTYTIKLALQKIEENIISRTAHNKVTITTSEEDNWLTIEITQIGSYAYCDVNDDKINKTGNLIDIKNMLQSLCDFSVISNFRENGEEATYKIDYLYTYDADAEPRHTKLSTKAKGFTYILKFYTR